MNPSLNYGYQTIPQKHLYGKVIDYDRGKGLGGSSSINFACWTVGPSDDYDDVARLVGDDEWNWTNAQQRYKRLESYYGKPCDLLSGADKYLSPNAEYHGDSGPIKIGFPGVWEKSLGLEMDAFLEAGASLNPDANSGNPVGLSVAASTAYKGVRSTAADALLDAPDNLTILTNKTVVRVVFDGKKARGVELLDGEKISADREVIVSSGTLDSPRILMHSGIGPKDQLDKFEIHVVYANPHVGQHLKDHHHVHMNFQQAEHTTERQHFYRDKDLQGKAREQWEKDGSGPLAEIGVAIGMGFAKSDNIYQSPEFQSLPADVKTNLKRPTVPLYEHLLNGASAEYFMDPDNTPAMATLLALFSTRSRGALRVAIESTRELLKIVNHPAFQKNTVGVMLAPKSESEEDILDYWKQYTTSTWHMLGTAVMGKSADEAVVDKNFKVFGVEGLRVADMSIYPLLPSNHTQTNAYLVGLMLGDKLVDEYQLEQ